ncbi:MAG: DUF2520 domain-containing protein [Peptococcaceae bacterium]|nr:DUF2520 domain-containing protein [Peptococcaceae bacterium]
MLLKNKPAVAIIGAGRVGSALAVALAQKGYPLAGVASRTRASAEKLAARVGAPSSTSPVEAVKKAGVIFITTPDRTIARVAVEIARRNGFHAGQVVAHTSGAHSAGILAPVRNAGATIASMHPLQSFAGVEQAVQNLPGSYFSLEGDTAAVRVLAGIVHDLGGRYFTLDAGDKALYHTAACIASNYLVSLLHMAAELLKACGVPYREAPSLLRPLITGTLNNISDIGLPKALTGPVARGDVNTVREHLKALAASPLLRNIEEQYRSLGRYTVEVARAGCYIDNGTAEKIKELLEEVK